VPEYENPSEATSGSPAEGNGEALAFAPTNLARSRRTATPIAETRPTITATLSDGPLEGSNIETEVVEGRPPKTIDLPADDGSTCRYCLAGWVQTGRSAAYTFLYRV
jgi:hypothetical protein